MTAVNRRVLGDHRAEEARDARGKKRSHGNTEYRGAKFSMIRARDRGGRAGISRDGASKAEIPRRLDIGRTSVRRILGEKNRS